MAGKNLFILGFKKLPKAATIVVLFILLIEVGSMVSLNMIRRISGGGDLIKMDSDLFNRNLRKYITDPQINRMYIPKTYNSWKECWADASYDVIVTGDSTAGTGWAEMLQLDYGVKTLNAPYVTGGIAPVIANYDNKKNTKTVLLWVTLTEGTEQVMHPPDTINEPIKNFKGCDIRQKNIQASKKMTEYVLEKIRNLITPKVEIVDINGRPELFYAPHIKGLTKDISYSADEYSKLCEQLKYMKDITAEKGCIFAIVAFPTKPQQYEWLLIKAGRLNSVSKRTNLNILKEACKKNNISFLNIEERLDPIAKQVFLETGKLLWYRCDSHMNEMGAYCSAKLINYFLSEIRK